MQGKDTALSDDQKTLISEILENIDADNLSQEQAVEIAEAFSAAGIVPGKDLAATLAESGFDARKIGDLARNAQRPQAQSTSEQVDLTELVDYLDTLLEQFSGSSLSDADKTSVYEGLRERFGLDEGDAIINVTA
tara:strand:+ start:7519 stop:7923 length:405 start_codon:yes stop_codon:yes gene_type:complete